MNPAFNAQQVVSALTHLEASHLVVGTETNLPFKAPRSNDPLLEHLVSDLACSRLSSNTVPSLKQLILVDNSSGQIDVSSKTAVTPFLDLLNNTSSAVLPPQNLSNHDVINIQFTSGTTSTPKAACLTHRSILNNGYQIGSRMLLTPRDVVCCPPPLFHCFGCILGYMATATHGSAIVFPSESFDPKASLLALQEEKATALYGVPTMFLAELELLANGSVENEGFEHLRTGIAAGSSIPAEVMRKLHKTLNLSELTICYGMTETSPVSFMTTTDDPMDKRINTVGRLLPHVEAKIVEAFESNKTIGVGERGELAVSGYLTMQGYWGQPEKTAEALRIDQAGQTWMYTGDEAEMDQDGYVSITGRIKDLIIRGGENIHPLEIENCLFGHPAIKEVSVVGVPDERYGEIVVAFVIPREDRETILTVEDVRGWVRDRLSHHLGEFHDFSPENLLCQKLTSLEVPTYVFFVDEYPKTASGKIQKFKLREMGFQMLKAG